MVDGKKLYCSYTVILKMLLNFFSLKRQQKNELTFSVFENGTSVPFPHENTSEGRVQFLSDTLPSHPPPQARRIIKLKPCFATDGNRRRLNWQTAEVIPQLSLIPSEVIPSLFPQTKNIWIPSYKCFPSGGISSAGDWVNC